jgi:hypothetical protein
MIEKRLLFGRGRRVNKKYCMRWIAFSALIFLILLSLTTPVFALEEVTTDKGSYALGETVYATATGLTSGNDYDFYYNTYPLPGTAEGDDTKVRADGSGECGSLYTLAPGPHPAPDPTGDWFVRVVNWKAGNTPAAELCHADFTVTDVPEFPSIFALGAGIMFLICGAIYLGMRKHAMRKV